VALGFAVRAVPPDDLVRVSLSSIARTVAPLEGFLPMGLAVAVEYVSQFHGEKEEILLDGTILHVPPRDPIDKGPSIVEGATVPGTDEVKRDSGSVPGRMRPDQSTRDRAGFAGVLPPVQRGERVIPVQRGPRVIIIHVALLVLGLQSSWDVRMNHHSSSLSRTVRAEPVFVARQRQVQPVRPKQDSGSPDSWHIM
jgi:hypothetical protein